MANKNNNLKDEIKDRNTPRNGQRRYHNHSHREDKQSKIDEALDYIGASDGVTFLANGSPDGSDKVSEEDFENILKKMLAAESNKQKQKNNPSKNTTSGLIESFPFGCNPFNSSFTSANFNPFNSICDDEEDEFNDELTEVLGEILGDDYEDSCPVESVYKAMMQTRPLGIDWEKDKVIDFLKKNGYEIHQKISKIDGSEFTVAYKEGVTDPIEELSMTNLSKEFSRTIQDIILGWLMKIK